MPNRFVILVVEDDEHDQLFIRTALLKHLPSNSLIFTVNHARQAIAYLMAEGQYSDRVAFPFPTLIVTDLKMPVSDGFDLLDHRRANPQWITIPTVVLSSSTDPDDIRTAYLLGASSYHQKPQSFENLCTLAATIVSYWLSSLVPEVDVFGRQVLTRSEGKLGQRFPQAPLTDQKRIGE